MECGTVGLCWPVVLLPQRSGMRCHRVVPMSEPHVIAYAFSFGEFLASSFSVCSAYSRWKRHVRFMSTGGQTSLEEILPNQNNW